MKTIEEKEQEQNAPAAFFFLALYTTSILIRPHEIYVETQQWIVIRIFMICCFILLILSKIPFKLYPQHWMLASLLPLIVVSGFLNGSGFIGLKNAQNFFLASILPLILYSLCITKISQQKLLMWVSIIASLLMVHNGYIQNLTASGYGWAGLSRYVGEGRITYLGFFEDPNDIGTLFVMNLPFLIYFYSEGGFLKKLLMLLILLAFAYGVFLTDSRGTMIGAGALVVMYWLVMSGGAKLFLAVVVSAPIIATVIFSFAEISQSDSSAEGRLEAWYFGIQTLLHNPVFGIGYGNFMEEHGRVAHNSYIHLATELGVFGYSLWGGALLFTVATSYLIINERKKLPSDVEINKECKDELLINKTLFFSMLGYMITAFFLSRSYKLVLFVFMGMTIASHIRLLKLMPEYLKYFNVRLIYKSMLYSWILIVAVYLALKVGL